MDEKVNGYDLNRNWFNFCFDNPELIKPIHTAVYMFSIEHCNRLGWKKKFGFPSQMTMEAIGVRKHQTYIKAFNDLVAWGFFKLVQKSTNQYSSNIISLINALPKKGKALDKALVKHRAKQGQSTGQSKGHINKQENKETKEQENIYKYSKFYDFELENKKEEHHPHYKNFVAFLFGKNEIGNPLTGVLNLQGQISNKKFTELFQIATAHNKKITDAIIEIENGKYYVGKTYFSATLIKWLRNEKYS